MLRVLTRNGVFAFDAHSELLCGNGNPSGFTLTGAIALGQPALVQGDTGQKRLTTYSTGPVLAIIGG